MADERPLPKNCSRCGTDLKLTLPEGTKEDSLGVRMMVKMAVLCEDCAEQSEREERTAEQQDRINHLIEGSGIPEEYRALKWDEMVTGERRQPAIEAAKAWADGKIKGLLIGGPVGTGKTRLAATAAWHRLNLAKPVKWVSVAKLVKMETAGFGTEEKKEATKLLMKKAPLVLDDLDKVALTESVRSLLFLAIDTRTSSGVPLLVTTNLPKEQFEATLGAAISSRLLGYCTTASLVGKDRRQDS